MRLLYGSFCRTGVLLSGAAAEAVLKTKRFLTKAAEEPFAAYLKRNPPKKSSAPDEIAEDMTECP